MDYRPRFAQPFTLNEAIGLDVGVITEGGAIRLQNPLRLNMIKTLPEIARLQNSLKHLKETQTILESTLKEEGGPDPELRKAFEENEAVMCVWIEL